MSDLISRSALRQEVLDNMPQGSARGVFLAFIEEQPTAYDVEKVVADIKAYPAGSHIERQVAYNIIRKGGVNDNNRTC